MQIRFIFLIITIFALNNCGKRGALYLPQENKTEIKQQKR